jgi:hypothetical protein
MKSQAQRAVGLETEVIDDVEVQTGRDPRNMTPDELRALGHRPMSILQSVRARCLDCCGGSPAEVRRCVSVNRPSWPFRMGSNPWRERRELSPERRAQLADALAKARASKVVA